MKKIGIDIIYHSTIKLEKFEEILYGIEEEEIPYNIFTTCKDISSNDVYTDGKLEIGIAVCKNGDIFLNKKGFPKEFILKNNLNSSKEELRNFGQNSAKIIKGKSLKGLLKE